MDKNTEKVWKVLIVGYGVVGHNLRREIAKGRNISVDVVDKYKPDCNTVTRGGVKYDIAFICVDTPKTAKTPCDCQEVANAIVENNAEVYVIKSTVLPGTSSGIREASGKRVIFSPEYYGGTQHCNNFDFPFTIAGGPQKDCRVLVQMLQNVYDARHQFRITDSTTAELVKYMENSYLATKVSFCNQFYLIAEQLGVDYEELRELFVLDERVNPAHTFVYRDKPYWESHCLDKDVPAIALTAKAPFLRAVIEFNDYCKETYRKRKQKQDATARSENGPGADAKETSEARKMREVGNTVVIGLSVGTKEAVQEVGNRFVEDLQEFIEKWKSEHPDSGLDK